MTSMEASMLWEVSAILFLGTFVRTAFGFGEALIAVPLLALLMPVEIAAPIAVLVSITVGSVMLLSDWRQVEFRSAFHLVLFTIIGIPLGLLMLVHVPEVVVKVILGSVMIGFALYCIFGKKKAYLSHDRYAWLFGVIAGILGGAYGVNGPPIVVYGALRHWSPQRFRATMQGYFLPTSIGILIGYSYAGLWVPAVTYHFLTALPAIAIAIVIGKVIGNRLSGPRFFHRIYGGLVLVGVALIAQALS
jgi:uncharacterized membrane protein YfcA